MDITELIAPNGVLIDLPAAGKKALFQTVAERLAPALGADEPALWRGLLERERLGSTAMGRGVAVPHCRLPGVDKIAGALVRLAQPIDFNAVDGEPVDLCFFLVAPEAQDAEHLRSLARVSRTLREHAALRRLRAAKSVDAMIAALGDAESDEAA